MSAPEAKDLQYLPTHVAIVMDGNGRWAQQQNKPRLFGHRAGAKSVRVIVEACRELEIPYLTLYAFSSENWNRPQHEVKGLMSILGNYLESELPKMLENRIRLTAIGDHQRLPEKVRNKLFKTMEATAANSEMTLNLALSYGGRDELVRAVQKIAERAANNELDPKSLDEGEIARHLDTAGIPDPDLLIRTGGEARLSNFLLWQLSYAEIYFTKMMWPDFRKKAFYQALYEYQLRERRFGRTGNQIRMN